METLKIKNVKDLETAKGDAYKKVDVMKEDGSVITGVSAFKFKYPKLEELVEGATVSAVVVIDGNYKNLVSAQEKRPTGNNGAYKTAQIKEMIDTKRQDISKFQDNKELSIKLASTMRMAVDLAIAERSNGHESLDTTFQESIRRWREWCWLEWDNTNSNTMPPF